MATDLLAYVQSRPRQIEQTWRDLYNAWTFPRSIVDGHAVVAGYALCEATDDSVELGHKVDEICVGLIARATLPYLAELTVDVMESGSEVTLTVAALAAWLDAVKAAEI